MDYRLHERHVAVSRNDKLGRHQRRRNKGRDLGHCSACAEGSICDSGAEVGVVLRVEDSVEDGDADCAADGAHSVQDANAEAELILRNAELRDREAELSGGADTQAGNGGEDDGGGDGGSGLENSDYRGLIYMLGR